jgi:hypothetical protein
LKSATVALLGLKATARAVEIHMPDPFAETPSEQMREWLLYSLFSLRDWPAGWPLEELGHQMEWLKRNGWNLPSEWLGEEGDAYRKRLGMRPPPKKVKRAWEKFLADAGEKSFADVEAEWLAATQGTTPHPRPEEKSQ